VSTTALSRTVVLYCYPATAVYIQCIIIEPRVGTLVPRDSLTAANLLDSHHTNGCRRCDMQLFVLLSGFTPACHSHAPRTPLCLLVTEPRVLNALSKIKQPG